MIPAVHLQLTGGTGWVITAAVVVITVSLALLGVSIYNSRAILENWDRVQDDADFGARGVGQLTEHLADLRSEVTAAMLDHAEQLDALREGLPAITEPVRIPTVEAAAAIDEWHALTTRRPVPYRRGDR